MICKKYTSTQFKLCFLAQGYLHNIKELLINRAVYMHVTPINVSTHIVQTHLSAWKAFLALFIPIHTFNTHA